MGQKFISNRDVFVQSVKYGRSYQFKKGVPRDDVIPQMHQDLLNKGILPVDEENQPVDPATHEVAKEADGPKILLRPEDGEERKAKILEVLRAIVKRNSSADFGAGGMPSPKSVTLALGWKVDNKDVSEVWKDHKAELLQE